MSLELKSLGGSRAVGVPLVIAFCGLPARGKSYLARKLRSFLRWRGFSVQVFNAGDYRRQFEGAGQSAEYFSSDNHEAAVERETLARMAFHDLVSWLNQGGEVALFDATNTTVARRNLLEQMCKDNGLAPPLFIESVCTDEKLLERNYRLKLGNEDYKDVDPAMALADFKKRVKMYEDRYEPVGDSLEEEDRSYIKVYNVGKKLVINNCNGWIKGQVVTILQNFHITPRRIFLTRHGECSNSIDGAVGRDFSLTNEGKEYAKKLASFMEKQQHTVYDPITEEFVACSDKSGKRELTLLSSAMKRSLETLQPLILSSKAIDNKKEGHRSSMDRIGSPIDWDSGHSLASTASSATASFLELDETGQKSFPLICTTALNEINAGMFQGASDSLIEEKFPEYVNIRKSNETAFRFPGGESYLDVIQRLHPIVLELERQRSDVLVVSHTVPIKLLVAYFQQQTAEAALLKEIPLHSVFEVRPQAFGCRVIEHQLS